MAARRSTSKTVLTTPSEPQPEVRLVRQAGPVADSSFQVATADGVGPGLPVRPGESPWTAEEVDEVRTGLAAELERLEREVAVLESNVANVMHESSDGAGDDHADTGSKAYGREQELAFLTSTRRTLAETRQALARFEGGRYGTCEACGRPVGKLRLQAFPRATSCLPCKQRQERR